MLGLHYTVVHSYANDSATLYFPEKRFSILSLLRWYLRDCFQIQQFICPIDWDIRANGESVTADGEPL